MNDTIALLERRRSVPLLLMAGPGPGREELTTILTIASRVPDHGKLAPWRFVVFEGEARERAGRIALEVRLAEPPAAEAGKHLGGKRLIEFDEFDIGPFEVGPLKRLIRCGHGSDPHAVWLDGGERPTDEPAEGTQAEFVGLLFRRHNRHGGGVVLPAGVSGSDRRTVDLSVKDRAQLGKLVHGRTRPWMLVDRDQHVIGTAATGYSNGDRLVVE